MFCQSNLKDSENNYNTTDLEATVLIFAIHKFKQYLNGIQFNVITDRQALVFLKDKRNLSSKYAKCEM